MTESQQNRYDDAMYEFSRENYQIAVAELEAILAEDETVFDARLSLGMAYCRMGEFDRAIAEGHKAEDLKPKEQLVHTNLSLFYMRSGDKQKAEHHGLQARIASWREDLDGPPPSDGDQEDSLSFVKPPSKTFKTPEQFPDMPWKEKK